MDGFEIVVTRRRPLCCRSGTTVAETVALATRSSISVGDHMSHSNVNASVAQTRIPSRRGDGALASPDSRHRNSPWPSDRDRPVIAQCRPRDPWSRPLSGTITASVMTGRPARGRGALMTRPPAQIGRTERQAVISGRSSARPPSRLVSRTHMGFGHGRTKAQARSEVG